MKTTVIQVPPPWYLQLLGRKYWKGWRVQVVLYLYGQRYVTLSEPAPRAPNPDEVARVTGKMVQVALTEAIEYLPKPGADNP